jgi:hypothetical protein
MNSLDFLRSHSTSENFTSGEWSMLRSGYLSSNRLYIEPEVSISHIHSSLYGFSQNRLTESYSLLKSSNQMNLLRKVFYELKLETIMSKLAREFYYSSLKFKSFCIFTKLLGKRRRLHKLERIFAIPGVRVRIDLNNYTIKNFIRKSINTWKL